MTEQQLLEEWVGARCGVISEHSGSISHDVAVVVERAEAYAAQHCLDTAFLEAIRATYVVPA